MSNEQQEKIKNILYDLGQADPDRCTDIDVDKAFNAILAIMPRYTNEDVQKAWMECYDWCKAEWAGGPYFAEKKDAKKESIRRWT